MRKLPEPSPLGLLNIDNPFAHPCPVRITLLFFALLL